MASKQKIISIFLDSNVLIAAVISEFSSKGGSALKLINYCVDKRWLIMISKLVEEEVKRNLARIDEEAIRNYEDILKKLRKNKIFVVIPEPTPKEIEIAAQTIHKNDAPILAAALKSNPDYLLTYNRRHFIKPKVKAMCNFQCLTPDWFFKEGGKREETLG